MTGPADRGWGQERTGVHWRGRSRWSRAGKDPARSRPDVGWEGAVTEQRSGSCQAGLAEWVWAPMNTFISFFSNTKSIHNYCGKCP